MTLLTLCCVQEVAKQNAEYVGYATPNEAAKALLPVEVTEDETLSDIGSH